MSDGNITFSFQVRKIELLEKTLLYILSLTLVFVAVKQLFKSLLELDICNFHMAVLKVNFFFLTKLLEGNINYILGPHITA
jgi:hypothetical protein